MAMSERMPLHPSAISNPPVAAHRPNGSADGVNRDPAKAAQHLDETDDEASAILGPGAGAQLRLSRLVDGFEADFWFSII